MVAGIGEDDSKRKVNTDILSPGYIKKEVDKNGINDTKIASIAEKGWATCEGLLEKKSPAVLKGWQERYFVLQKDSLDYFKDGVPVQKGTIDVKNITTVEINEKIKRNLI
eukprot:UN27530